MNASRRHLLSSVAALAAGSTGIRTATQGGLALGLAGISGLAQDAVAADTSGYKALVCVFLQGGCDMHNWLVPTDTAGYAQYAAVRGSIGVVSSRLQQINSRSQAPGRTFGMPSELAPLRELYSNGRVAIVSNVGTLTRPVTKADFAAGVGLPPRLFSHNDQQSIWQSLSPEGARSGWGGRMGDILASANAQPLFTAISATGTAVFLSGSSVVQYQVTSDGPVSIKALYRTWLTRYGQGSDTLKSIVLDPGSNPLQSEQAKIFKRAIDAESALSAALTAVPQLSLPTQSISFAGGSTSLDKEPLARQLRVVARIIAAQKSLGMRRQVFMVSMGGFDMHNYQARDEPGSMARVASSLRWFHDALESLGLGTSVTTFTGSDFGRTLTNNGDGSDHGWGSHHFVMGGAVKGGDIYGQFPETALGTATDAGSGRLIPTTAVTQLANSLGRWMGVSSTEMASVLPDLGNFSTTTLPLF